MDDLQPCMQPNFDPTQDSLNNLLVWVRIPCLPIEYFDHHFLIHVGSKIGKPVKIDDATNAVSREHYARICVEVDLSKPLVAKFRLRRRIRRLEYEGIHLVCFDVKCTGIGKTLAPLECQGNPVAPEHHQGEGSLGTSERMVSNAMGRTNDTYNPEIVEDFGPWMIAKSRVRKNQNTPRGNGDPGTEKGTGKEDSITRVGLQSKESRQSNFSILIIEGEENLAVEDIEEITVDTKKGSK